MLQGKDCRDGSWPVMGPECHTRLIEAMRDFGYPPHGGGVCNSYALMAMQAFFSHELNCFCRRIQYIVQTKDTAQQYQKLQEKLTDHARTRTTPTLTSNEHQLIDLLIFFAGMEIFQSPKDYFHLFNAPVNQQSVAAISAMIGAKKIEKYGGIRAVKSWPGIYTKKELALYLHTLTETVKTQEQDVALTLNSTNHNILLCYDRQFAAWYLFNANQMPLKKLTSQHDASLMADDILNAFEETNIAAFETTMYSGVTEKKAAIEKIVRELENKPAFQSIHQVTAAKAELKTSDGNSLAYIAAAYNHTDVIKKLAALKVDLNLAVLNGLPAAFVAAQHGHVDMIKTLQQLNIDLNAATNEGATPLFIAAQNGQAQTVAALIAAQVELNTRTSHGLIAAQIALTKHHTYIFEMLVKADPDISCSVYGIDSAKLAAKLGNVEALKILSKNGVDLRQSFDNGDTLLTIAEEHQQQEAIAFLRESLAPHPLNPHRFFPEANRKEQHDEDETEKTSCEPCVSG